MYYTYVLFSLKFNQIYIGQTKDLRNRLKKHNAGLVRSTKSYLPWSIVYVERFSTRTEAMRREKELKSYKGREFIRVKIKQLAESASWRINH